MIKDSGNRTEFESGAVRDIQKGKGRCDLLPLEVVKSILTDPRSRREAKPMELIKIFQNTGDIDFLDCALREFASEHQWDLCTMILEVSVHFEEGAEKYGENNWQKGLPAKSYINSAIRHYLKWLRGDDDERHDRAFVWNILCCMWTCIHNPELNDYGIKPPEEE